VEDLYLLLGDVGVHEELLKENSKLWNLKLFTDHIYTFLCVEIPIAVYRADSESSVDAICKVCID